MKLALSLVLAAVIVQSADGFLIRFFVNLFLQPLLDTACTAAQTTLKLENNTNCACTGEYLGVGRGFDGDVKCSLRTSPCLIQPNDFCVNGALGAGLAFGFSGGAKLDTNIEGCFNVTNNSPLLSAVGNINNFCLTFIPSGLKLKNCTAKIGATPCRSCEVCPTGVDFKFDCSNVDLYTKTDFPNLFIPGPNFQSCIGLGLVGGIPGPRNITNTTRF
jgi:hypothetical protein